MAPLPFSARESGDACDEFLSDVHLRKLRLKGRPKSAGSGGFRAAAAALAAGGGREHQQLLAALEKEYAPDLIRISPNWTFGGSSSSKRRSRLRDDDDDDESIDAVEALGLPASVLGAILAGKCRDQLITATKERQKRFAEWIVSNCSSKWFVMNDASVGPECAKGIMLALALTERFTSLNVSCNCLGDAGAATIALALSTHRCLTEVDLAANDIGHRGANALFEMMQTNQSVKTLDLSSRPGALRNRLNKCNSAPLEVLMLENRTLSKMLLTGTGLGPEGVAGLARGLSANSSLLILDIAGNDLGSKGVASIAEALRGSSLEELNLSDNHVGDEGLAALGTALGALPQSVESKYGTSVWGGSPEGIKASLKYPESVVGLRRAVLELSLKDLKSMSQKPLPDIFVRLKETTTQFGYLVKSADLYLPCLKVLQLSNTGASVAGISRIEDALQVNNVLQRLTLDSNDHRDPDIGVSSIMVSMVSNWTLRYLSLAHCNIGTPGMINLSKALATNEAVKFVNLCGNKICQDAAAAIGAMLAGGGGKAMRTLNLASCHMDDAAGIALASGLATNSTLNVLILRDNCLHEVAGLALSEALQRNGGLIELNLEMNSIDLRFLTQIKHLLERNNKFHHRAMPEVYSARIDQLKECEKEVDNLQSTLERNLRRKRRAMLMQAAKLQELKDWKANESVRLKVNEDRIEELYLSAREVEEDIVGVEAKLSAIRAEGDYEAGQLYSRIRGVEDKVAAADVKLNTTRKQQEQFEEEASRELSEVREELDRAEKARSSAQLLATAAQRNLDSFSASLKAIGEDIAGGTDPRQRLIEVVPPKEGKPTRPNRPKSPGGAARVRKPDGSAPKPDRPKSANRSARPSSGKPKLGTPR